MKHILFTKELLLLVVALFAIIATSCIKEDLDQCYTLKLKVENIKGDDITEYGWMESTDLYIFDENLNYLEKRRLDKNFIRSRNEIVLDGYTADRSLRIVAWGSKYVVPSSASPDTKPKRSAARQTSTYAAPSCKKASPGCS